MKKLMFLLMFLPLFAVAQDENTPKETTLFYFDLIVDEAFQADLIGLKEGWDQTKMVLKNQDPLVAGIIDDVYANLSERLENEGDVMFQSVDTLKNSEGKKLAYSPYGYPMSLKKRAMTHKTAPHYAYVQVHIYPRKGNVSNLKTGTYQSEKKKLKPFVKVTVKLYDENGDKIGGYVGKAVSKEAVEVKTQTIMRWFEVGDKKRFDEEENQNVLDDTINAAIDDLIVEMKK